MTEISNGNRKTLLLSLSNTVVEDSVTFINPSYQYASSVDLNNDSYFEHVYFAKGEGVLILDHQLDSLTYFQDTTITGIARASGDFNNNGNFDIIYNFNCLGSKGIKISTFSGINIAKLPIVGSVLKSDIWVADVNDDGHIEMEFTSDDGTNEFYSLLDFPLAGSRIACQGELANYRNTGCYNHAPYLPGDSASIVYWYNTISVYDTVTLPANDTIVITAGTRVLFGESAQLVIQGTLIVKGSYYHPVIFEADVSGADNNYWEGICFKNNSASSLRYCIVKDASFGIYYEDNSTSHIIEHSEMTNCEVGIGAFQARTVIKNCYIHENDIGIGCYSSASPVLADNYFPYTHYNNLINNNEVCIGLNLSRVKINKGYNDIYNDSATGYYMQFLAEQRPILIMSTYNYWGSTDTSAIQQRLSPASWFDITPICDSANTLKSSEIIEEIFKNACMAFDNKQYEQAIPLFKQLIDYYPLSSQAYDAVSGMYNTFVESSTNRDEIINYFDLKDADTSINKSLYHIINTNLNFIRRDLGNYEEAFNDYYNKLQSNPTYCDSIYALIRVC